jgi:hypothetical protein
MQSLAASRISAAPSSALDSAIPNAGQAQTNASGPGGGSGETQHVQSRDSAPAPATREVMIGPTGSPPVSRVARSSVLAALSPVLNWIPSRRNSSSSGAPSSALRKLAALVPGTAARSCPLGRGQARLVPGLLGMSSKNPIYPSRLAS